MITITNTVTLPFDYSFMDDFHEGYACIVNLRQKLGFLDDTGGLAIPFEYSAKPVNSKGLPLSVNCVRPTKFMGGMAGVCKDDKCGFIDTKGHIVIPFVYDDVQNFKDGIASVKKGEKWGAINQANEIIIPFEYDRHFLFCEGLAAVYKNAKFGYIDKSGKMILQTEYPFNLSFGNFSEGLAAIKQNDMFGYIDETASVKISFELDYDAVGQFQNSFAFVQKNGKYGIISKEGNLIVPVEYDMVFAPCITAIKSGSITRFDANGNKLFSFAADSMFCYSEGLIGVITDGKYGFLNENGTLAIVPQYACAMPFCNGYSVAKTGEKWGIINRSGNTVLPFVYDQIGNLSSEKTVAIKGNKAYILHLSI